MYRLVGRVFKSSRALGLGSWDFIGLVRSGWCSLKGWCHYYLNFSGSQDWEDGWSLLELFLVCVRRSGGGCGMRGKPLQNGNFLLVLDEFVAYTVSEMYSSVGKAQVEGPRKCWLMGGLASNAIGGWGVWRCPGRAPQWVAQQSRWGGLRLVITLGTTGKNAENIWVKGGDGECNLIFGLSGGNWVWNGVYEVVSSDQM